MSNYANIQIKDVLTRVDGVGSITVFGARDYAMQVWLDPNRLQSLNLTAPMSRWRCRGRTSRSPRACSISRRCRTSSPSRSRCARSAGCPIRSSSAISWSSRPPNAVVRIKDVARVELTGQDYSSTSYLDRNPSVALAVFQRPGSNALTTGDNIRSDHAPSLSKNFPAGHATTRSSTIRPSSSGSPCER